MGLGPFLVPFDLLYTALVTLCSLLLSLAIGLTGGWPLPAAEHLAFAVGIVPLIFAAMGHFVPVLTRSGNPPKWVIGLPLAAQGAGGLAVAVMAGALPRGWLHGAAGLDLLLALVLLGWIIGRARHCLGAPHPGWRWYGAALACLIGALVVVPLMAALTPRYPLWRLLHLHLNTLGLVGLAALGTLPVLLPTALGLPDPEAAGWLRRRLWPMLGGAVAVAVGAAFLWPLSVVGAALLFVGAFGLAGQWVRRFGIKTLVGDGVSVSLVLALFGFLLIQVAGVLHGAGFLAARPTIATWVAAFLIPLVTGALSQLLPVWRWPGPRVPARDAMRRCLAAGGAWRAVMFVAAGGAFMLDAPVLGGPLLAAGMALFAIGVIRAVRVGPSAR